MIKLAVNIDEVEKGLETIQANLVKVRRKTLQVVAQGTRKALNAAIRFKTKRRTGELLKAYRYKVRKDASQVSIFPKGLTAKSKIFPKVYALNYGSEKRNIKPRSFIQAGELYAQEGEYMRDVEKKVIEKELLKYWED